MHCTLMEGSAQGDVQAPTQAPRSWERLALGTVQSALHKVIAPQQYMPHLGQPGMILGFSFN